MRICAESALDSIVPRRIAAISPRIVSLDFPMRGGIAMGPAGEYDEVSDGPASGG
jgi:hypothetical protein